MVKIRHTSPGLSEELKHLKPRQELDPLSVEILREIRRLEVYVTMHLEEVPSDKSSNFNTAIMMSNRTNSPDTQIEEHGNLPIVDIFGACNANKYVPIAGYGVYWGKGDPRNSNGRPPGVQNSYRAGLMALDVALSQALHGNHEVIVRSRCPKVHQIITSFRSGSPTSLWTGTKHDDLIVRINEKLANFENLIHLLPRRSLHIEGQREAERLASELSETRHDHVSICGLGTTSDGISRFSLFWGPKNPKNEAGWENGNHSSFCSEITALQRALLRSLKNDVKFLTVYTHSEQLLCFVNIWREEWRRFGWPTPSGGRMKCIEVCKDVDAMLDKMTVCFRPGREADIIAARKQAEDVVGPTVVFTTGTFMDEDKPIAKYNVFWGPEDMRNKSRRIFGEQCPVRAKLMAIRRAMETALQHGITQLIVKTDYTPKDGIDVELINEIRNLKKQFSFIKLLKLDVEKIRKLTGMF